MPDFIFYGYDELSLDHLGSAQFFAEEAAKLENEFCWDQNWQAREKKLKNAQITDVGVHTRSFAFVSSSVFASIAFLNAAINEVFPGAAKYNKEKSAGRATKSPFEHLPASVIDALTEIKFKQNIKLDGYPGLEKKLEYADKGHYANKQFHRWYLLNKFQLALYLAHGQTRLLSMTDSIWKDVKLVFQLRDILIHNQPVLILHRPPDGSYEAVEDSDPAQRTVTLLTYFKEHDFWNRLIAEADPSNIGRVWAASLTYWLGAKSAVWAIQSCLKFALEFYKRMPMPTRERLIESRLEELDYPPFVLTTPQ
jgi:hypothetical protein